MLSYVELHLEYLGIFVENLEHCRNSSIGRYLREAVALNTLPCEAREAREAREACEAREALEFAGDPWRPLFPSIRL